MGADYTFYVKTIETHARAFLTLNILAIGRVMLVYNQVMNDRRSRTKGEH